MRWDLYTNSAFADMWLAYTCSFERVLNQWEADDFHKAGTASPQPLGGLFGAIGWSLRRAEEKQ